MAGGERLNQSGEAYSLKQLELGLKTKNIGHLKMRKFSGWCWHDPLVLNPLDAKGHDFAKSRKIEHLDFAQKEAHHSGHRMSPDYFGLEITTSDSPEEQFDFCAEHGIVEPKFGILLESGHLTFLGLGFVTHDQNRRILPQGAMGFVVTGWTPIDQGSSDIYRIVLPSNLAATLKVRIIDRVIDTADIYTARNALYGEGISREAVIVRGLATDHIKGY